MSDLRKGGLCPACEKGRLAATEKDLVFTYKNKPKRFKSERVFKCDLCGYEGLDRKNNRRIEKVLTDFRRTIDGLLTSDQLQRIRESLNLNKKTMARLLSINEKTIGRYENGKITQSEQVDKLYRILGAIPAAARILDSDRSIFEVESIRTVTYNPQIHRAYRFSADRYAFCEEYTNVAAA